VIERIEVSQDPRRRPRKGRKVIIRMRQHRLERRETFDARRDRTSGPSPVISKPVTQRETQGHHPGPGPSLLGHPFVRR
jgi:hypothetical protein